MHQKAKKKFGEQYGVDSDEYDYCYNIFGELMEKEYLEQIVRQYERRKEAYRSYQESWGSNYSGGSSSSYSIPVSSTYSKEAIEERDRQQRLHDALMDVLDELPGDLRTEIVNRYWRCRPGDSNAHQAALRFLRHPSRCRRLMAMR